MTTNLNVEPVQHESLDQRAESITEDYDVNEFLSGIPYFNVKVDLLKHFYSVHGDFDLAVRHVQKAVCMLAMDFRLDECFITKVGKVTSPEE